LYRGRLCSSAIVMPITLLRRSCLIVAIVLTPSAGVPQSHGSPSQSTEGWATFYATRRAGRRTASGERYDPAALVAAHPTLPFGTQLRVTRVETGAAVVVRVIDRGPSHAQRRRGYIIDLSRAAAESLGFVRAGRTRVRVEVVGDAGAVRERAGFVRVVRKPSFVR
jgi:rare lipoprotein A